MMTARPRSSASWFDVPRQRRPRRHQDSRIALAPSGQDLHARPPQVRRQVEGDVLARDAGVAQQRDHLQPGEGDEVHQQPADFDLERGVVARRVRQRNELQTQQHVGVDRAHRRVEDAFVERREQDEPTVGERCGQVRHAQGRLDQRQVVLRHDQPRPGELALQLRDVVSQPQAGDEEAPSVAGFGRVVAGGVVRFDESPSFLRGTIAAVGVHGLAVVSRQANGVVPVAGSFQRRAGGEW